jgi:hypothetical protein
MKKNKASEALQQGQVLHHKNYTPNEYIYMKDDVIYDENNNSMGKLDGEFWSVRQDFKDGWIVVGELPPPFCITLIDKEPVRVTNKHSGESAILSPIQVAVYDTIKGSEVLKTSLLFEKGMDWFRKNYSTEYYILLD